jgi:RsiW-degrading membrane proteinase PrsW (M82 family)
LLAAAFLWGAIPALLIALILRIFIRLPVELLGSNAIETVRSGLISPLVEETLKGAVVIFIALRYRREFDDVLDGIIYGGIVGLGFAMNANIISYLGSFLTRGFAGLGNIILNEGIIYSLNHAFYSAIFGTGMGYARLATKRWQRWAIPLLAYLLAVLSHSTHNLLIRNALGLNPFTVVLSLMGILVIVVVVVWSLRNQQRCLQVELAEELPNELYQTVVRPGRRFYAQWQTLLHKGFRAWWRLRRTYQLCMEFAFKRMQARLFPEEDKIVAEAQALREKIGLFAEAE